jgi:hypothetical protein
MQAATRTPRLAALALLALLAPWPAVAGPPEGVSGRMAFDEVAEGLRKYGKETDREKRIRWLRKLAPTGDVRVAVALGDAWGDTDGGLGTIAQNLLAEHYCPKGDEPKSHGAMTWGRVTDWWKKNEADLRRRAKELPR